MSEPYTPTTDEIDTAATTYIWRLEKNHPGTYEEAPEFNDYGAVCKAFRRWLDQVRQEAKVEAAESALWYSRKAREFWKKVDDSSGQGCWMWLGSDTGSNGVSYGKFADMLAHRFSWALRFGEIPDGLVIRHRCDNGLCVNPDHLDIGTQLENVGDMIERRRAWFQKADCRNGHKRTATNTYINPSGYKQCLDCKKEWWAKGRSYVRGKKSCEECGLEVLAQNLARHKKKMHRADQLEQEGKNDE